MKSQLKLAFFMTLTLGASNMAHAVDATAAVSGSTQSAERVIPVNDVSSSASSNTKPVPGGMTAQEFQERYFNSYDFDIGHRCYAEVADFATKDEAISFVDSKMKSHQGLYLRKYPPYASGRWTVHIAMAVSEDDATQAMHIAKSLGLAKGRRPHCIDEDGTITLL